jgi:metallophosphoesterase superfamily enzyme
MNTIKFLITLLVVAVIAAACTASVRVMPSADNVNRVVARDIEKYGAEKAAHKAAVAYCEDHGMEAVFISGDVWYEGTMNEQQRATMRKQSEAAIIIGGIIKSNGNHDAGVVAESAGVAGSTMTSGKDYTAEVEFVCQAV